MASNAALTRLAHPSHFMPCTVNWYRVHVCSLLVLVTSSFAGDVNKALIGVCEDVTLLPNNECKDRDRTLVLCEATISGLLISSREMSAVVKVLRVQP